MTKLQVNENKKEFIPTRIGNPYVANEYDLIDVALGNQAHPEGATWLDTAYDHDFENLKLDINLYFEERLQHALENYIGEGKDKVLLGWIKKAVGDITKSKIIPELKEFEENDEKTLEKRVGQIRGIKKGDILCEGYSDKDLNKYIDLYAGFVSYGMSDLDSFNVLKDKYEENSVCFFNFINSKEFNLVFSNLKLRKKNADKIKSQYPYFGGSYEYAKGKKNEFEYWMYHFSTMTRDPERNYQYSNKESIYYHDGGVDNGKTGERNKLHKTLAKLNKPLADYATYNNIIPEECRGDYLIPFGNQKNLGLGIDDARWEDLPYGFRRRVILALFESFDSLIAYFLRDEYAARVNTKFLDENIRCDDDDRKKNFKSFIDNIFESYGSELEGFRVNVGVFESNEKNNEKLKKLERDYGLLVDLEKCQLLLPESKYYAWRRNNIRRILLILTGDEIGDIGRRFNPYKLLGIEYMESEGSDYLEALVGEKWNDISGEQKKELYGQLLGVAFSSKHIQQSSKFAREFNRCNYELFKGGANGSEREELSYLPYRLEAGLENVVGLRGNVLELPISAGRKYLKEIESIEDEELNDFIADYFGCEKISDLNFAVKTTSDYRKISKELKYFLFDEFVDCHTRWFDRSKKNKKPIIGGISGHTLGYLNLYREALERTKLEGGAEQYENTSEGKLEKLRACMLAGLIGFKLHHSYDEVMTASHGMGVITEDGNGKKINDPLIYKSPHNYDDVLGSGITEIETAARKAMDEVYKNYKKEKYTVYEALRNKKYTSQRGTKDLSRWVDEHLEVMFGHYKDKTRAQESAN